MGKHAAIGIASTSGPRPHPEQHAHTSTGFLVPQEAVTEPKEGYGHQRFTSHHPQHRNVVPTPYFGHVHRVNMQLRASLLAEEEVRAHCSSAALLIMSRHSLHACRVAWSRRWVSPQSQLRKCASFEEATRSYTHVWS